MLFILTDNSFMTQARLGWYDTAANNKMYFQAVDKDGGRHYVPTNFFTFYSYPFAHMAYGSPDAETAFALDNPNGGTQVYRKVLASLTCDVPVLTARDGAGRTSRRTRSTGPPSMPISAAIMAWSAGLPTRSDPSRTPSTRITSSSRCSTGRASTAWP